MSFLSPCNFLSKCYDFFCCRSRAAASHQPRPTAASRLAGTQIVLALVTNNRDMLADELETTLQQAEAASQAAKDALHALADLRRERQFDQLQNRILTDRVRLLERQLGQQNNLNQQPQLQGPAVHEDLAADELSLEELQPLIPPPIVFPLPSPVREERHPLLPPPAPRPPLIPEPELHIQDDPYPQRLVWPSVSQPSPQAPQNNELLDEVEQLKFAMEQELRQRKKNHEAKENWYRKNPLFSS